MFLRISIILTILAVAGCASTQDNKKTITYFDLDKITTGNPKAYYDSGMDKYTMGDNKGAIANFSKVIEIVPDFNEAYIYRGLAKYRAGNYKDAIEEFTKLIEKNINAYYFRALAKEGAGDYKGVIEDLTQAIEIDPKCAVAYHNRGVAKYRIKDYQDAIEDYNKTIELDPKNLGADGITYINRGESKFKAGDYKGAVADYNKAIELNPTLTYAWYNKACVYAKTGDKGKSLQDLAKAINLDKALKEYAKTDEDFKSLWEDEDFKKLTQ